MQFPVLTELAFWNRRRLPVLLQTEGAECGLACMAMVANYWGHRIDIPSMRRLFSVSMKGVNLKGLMAMARGLSLQTRPLKLDLQHLPELKLPCILHWDLNHFVVLKSISAKYAVLHDPAVGERSMELEDVSKHFTGIALEITPTAQFRPKEERQQFSLFSLIGHVVGLRRGLFQLLALGLALQVCALIAPFYMQWMVDEALLASDRDLVTVLGCGFLLLVLLQTAIGAVRSWVTTVLSTSLNLQWLGNTFVHLLKLPLPYFEKRHTGDIVSRFGSIQRIQTSLTTQFVEGVIDGVLALGTLVMMLLYSSALAAVACVAVLLSLNLVTVKLFGEMEFWFALVKVLAIVVFLVVGTIFLGTGKPLDGGTTGFHLITDNGGFFPHGLLPALVLVQGVVFAFASIELVGTAAGECKDPQTMVPKAINSVIWRIGLFYVGSVVLLVLLLPWNAYQAGQSPFVTFFSKLGVPYIGDVMNMVVLTAALSSLNSGLYSTGRILRSMSMGGSAPKFMSKMSKQHVPYAGILATLAIYVFGVVLNYLVPASVFEIVLNVAALGIIASWAFIVVCQMRLRKAIKEGKAADVSFKLPGAPVTSWLTLLFLLSVLVLMAFDYPNGTYTIASIPVIALLLVVGWYGVRKRVQEIHSTAPVHSEETAESAVLVEKTSS